MISIDCRLLLVIFLERKKKECLINFLNYNSLSVMFSDISLSSLYICSKKFLLVKIPLIGLIDLK